MCSCHFSPPSAQSGFHVYFSYDRCTINAQYYSDLPSVGKKDVRPYLVNNARQKLDRLAWETLQCPLYSPYVSTCIFCCFGSLKVISTVTKWWERLLSSVVFTVSARNSLVSIRSTASTHPNECLLIAAYLIFNYSRSVYCILSKSGSSNICSPLQPVGRFLPPILKSLSGGNVIFHMLAREL